jgi:serine/threonine-protein phosphatase 2A activator
MANLGTNQIPPFEVLDAAKEHAFAAPVKCINEGSDLSVFLSSHAYRDILAFIMHLNRSMFPLMDPAAARPNESPIRTFPLDEPSLDPQPMVISLQGLLRELDELIDRAPPDPGPRRFGNISFRKWSGMLEEQSASLLQKHLPSRVLEFKHAGSDGPREELRPYLLGSFGSPQRLDYGTGHELSFLAFIGCIWKLGGFGTNPSQEDMRHIVIGIIQP